MKYLLHIGRNKTGSSALQNFLYANRDVLSRNGVIYPHFGITDNAPNVLESIAHHKLARAIKHEQYEGLKQGLLAECRGHEHVVISSEVFATISEPSRVAEIFEPENTTIVIYLREHAPYLASWYQQSIHSTNFTYRFENFVESVDASHLPLVDSWAQVYGPQRVIVRFYDRGSLLDGDIIRDFLHATDLQGCVYGAQIPAQLVNPSISGNLLFFKRILNQFITLEESRNIPQEIDAIARLDESFVGKINVVQQVVDKINFHYRFDRNGLWEKYKLRITPGEEAIAGLDVPQAGRLASDWSRILQYARQENFLLNEYIKRMPNFRCE